MPRKVLITKDTLEEILAKYQGGSGGGSGKLYQLEFTAEGRGEGGTYIVIADSDNEFYSFDFKVLIYESEFERFVSEKNGTILSDDEPLNMPTNINDFVSYLNNLFVLDGRIPEQFEVLNNLVVYSNKTLICKSSDELAESDIAAPDFYFSFIHYSPKVVYDGSHNYSVRYYHNYEPVGSMAYIVFSTPCTLTEYGTSSDGQGGGTVEAEPIVSIKMTNLDARPTDAYEGADIIYTLEFCCTKERWDNFVSLASSQFQIDITYANFDSVFKQLNANLQGFVLGYLLMDYYENSKKILPNLLVYQTVLDRKIFTPSSFIGTIKNNLTNNIEVVAGMELKSIDGDGSLPNIADRTTVPYTTANTVITVQEVSGPAIGSSSGSGSSESTGMQRWTFGFDVANDVIIDVYTKFSDTELASMITNTNSQIDTINAMMSISLNHLSSFNDIGTLISQSQQIDNTGALAEILIGTFMAGLCMNTKTYSILEEGLLIRRTVVSCYPTVATVDGNIMVTNFNCMVVTNQGQFSTLQIIGANASADYHEF